MSEPTNKPPAVELNPKSGEPGTMVSPERRAATRLPFSASADICDIQSQAHIVGRCSDLGLGGCYVDTLSPLAVGASVRIRLERDLQNFEAMAVVAYAHVSMGMGLAFTDVKESYYVVLQGWVSELSGETPFRPEVVGMGAEGGIQASVVNLRQGLNELISLMVRKKVISEKEGAGLLHQMFR